jgi:tetratricopeptide (TPR) repeat protein
LRSKISASEKQQVTRLGTQNPEAYELYLKGRYSWNKPTASDIATAISYFNQALVKDPGYALAYSGLADAYNVLPSYGGNPSEVYPKSNAAARKALELDSTLAHPHAVLGSNEIDYDWDFAGGERSSRRRSHLTPTMPRHTNGTRSILATLAAGSRKRLLRPIVLTSSIRCPRSSP